MKIRRPIMFTLLTFLSLVAFASKQSGPPEFAWEVTQHAQGPVNDGAFDVAGYGEYSYLVGRLDGSLGEPTLSTARHPQGFVVKLDAYGAEVWTVTVDPREPFYPDRSFFRANTSVYAVATDESGVYITGSTNKVFDDAPPFNAPGLNKAAFVRKLDHSGNTLWTRQFPDATAYAIAVFEGKVYVSGEAEREIINQFGYYRPSAFVRTFSADGVEGWKKGFISICDVKKYKYHLCGWTKSYAVAADSTGVYMGGTTWGSIVPFGHSGKWDGWLIKYSHSGIEQWSDQIGQDENDFASDIATDGEHVVVVGRETKSLHLDEGCRPENRAWVGIIRSYDTDGDLQLTTDLPTSIEGHGSYSSTNGAWCPGRVDTEAMGVALTESGPAVVGSMEVSPFVDLETYIFDGDRDGFIRQYNWNGDLLLDLKTQHSGSYSRLTGGFGEDLFTRGGESLYGIDVVQGNLVAAGATDGFVEGGMDTAGSSFSGWRDALAMGVVGGAIDWAHQFGTLKFGTGQVEAQTNSIVNDTRGGAYTALESEGVVPGHERTSTTQIHVSHYKANGKLDWIRQIGSMPAASAAEYVGMSANRKGVYVLWRDHPNYGDQYAHREGVLTRYSPKGELLWEQRIIGASLQSVYFKGITTQGAITYVVGSGQVIEDGIEYSGTFLKAYDEDGSLLWTQRTDGSSGPGINIRNLIFKTITSSRSGVYIGGYYYQTRETVQLIKLELDGTPAWIVDVEGVDTSQVDSFFYNLVFEIDAYKDNIYVAGQTREVLDGDSLINNVADFFVRRYDSSGLTEWTRQIGSAFIAISGHDKGVTLLNSYGKSHSNEGLLIEDGNSVIRQYDDDGNVAWTKQYGDWIGSRTQFSEYGKAIDAKSNQTIFIAGVSTVLHDEQQQTRILSIKKLENDSRR